MSRLFQLRMLLEMRGRKGKEKRRRSMTEHSDIPYEFREHIFPSMFASRRQMP